MVRERKRKQVHKAIMLVMAVLDIQYSNVDGMVFLMFILVEANVIVLAAHFCCRPLCYVCCSSIRSAHSQRVYVNMVDESNHLEDLLCVLIFVWSFHVYLQQQSPQQLSNSNSYANARSPLATISNLHMR